MADSESIKHFNVVRNYMRDFYVYGFRSRNDYKDKSPRVYDTAKSRLEKWLYDYMYFRNTDKGKNVFISIESREISVNPLYNAWKAGSWTGSELTQFFIIFDILFSPEIKKSAVEIFRILETEYLYCFEEREWGISRETVRRNLEKYADLGMLKKEKCAKEVLYSRYPDIGPVNGDLLDFFSEAAPCGVVGSYISDHENNHEENFQFKHHYITGALDSEIMYMIFDNIRNKNSIEIQRFDKEKKNLRIVPVKVFISTQSGRQHLLAWNCEMECFSAFRIDFIEKILKPEKESDFDIYRERFREIQKNIWGVNPPGPSCQGTKHVEFTVYVKDTEKFIYDRLMREKRCGTVEAVDDNHYRFSADIYDISEIIPWIRTFIWRITDLNFSDKEAEKQFRDDIETMYRMYGVEDSNNDIQ